MFHYGKAVVENVESEVSHMVKQTLDRGISDSGVLSFRIPADSDRFTDLNKIYMRVELKVRHVDGTPLAEEDVVCLDTEGMHSLFASCDVSFNGEVVSSMNSYPFTTHISRMLGTSSDMRTRYLDLGGWFLGKFA